MTSQDQGRPVAVVDGGMVADDAEQRAVTRKAYNAAEQKIIAQRSWFAKLLPKPEQGGIGAEPFTVALLSQMQRTATRRNGLMAAALNDVDSLIYAASDCAARNLWPGEEYWFVPFNDVKNKTGLHVTGMPGWKGELQQIYRSGMVDAVVCELVYEGDRWVWKPTRMRVPDHEPSDTADHSPASLRRVYCFAHLAGSTEAAPRVTYPVVLNSSDIATIERFSKAPADFWQSAWRPRMWLKSAIHNAYDRLPHSSAWNMQLVEAFQAAQTRYPGLMLDAEGSDLTAIPPGVEVPGAVAGEVETVREERRPARPVPPQAGRETIRARPVASGAAGDDAGDAPWPDQPNNGQGGNGNGDGGGQAAADPAGQAPGEDAPPDPGGPVSPSTGSRLSRKFQGMKWTGEEYRDRRRVVSCYMAAVDSGRPARMVASVAEMTEGEAAHACDIADGLLRELGGDLDALSGKLQAVYDAWAAEKAAKNGPAT